MQPNIRTYGRRRGRVSAALPCAEAAFWYPEWVPCTVLPDFGTKIVELGFGMGDSLLAMAKNHPDCLFIGIEVYEPGIQRLLKAATTHKLTNLLILAGDALKRFFGASSTLYR